MANEDDAARARRGNAGGPPSRTVSFHHLRRQSTSERIHEILEVRPRTRNTVSLPMLAMGDAAELTMDEQTARDRAEGMGPDPVPMVRRRPSQEEQQHSDDEVGADGVARKVARESGPNSQAVQPGGSSIRSRRSIYSHNHPRSSQYALSDDDEEEPPPPSRPQQQHQQHQQHQQQQQQQQQARGRAAGDKANTPWWRKPLGKFQSVELENKGSVARDHLALERTFLAWLRTSLAFASIGIAVTQLFRLNTSLSEGAGGDANGSTLRRVGKPLGATFLAISILTLLLGFRRYFRGQEWVMRGKFPASRGTIIVIAFLALAIMLVSLVVVIVIHPSDTDEAEDL